MDQKTAAHEFNSGALIDVAQDVGPEEHLQRMLVEPIDPSLSALTDAELAAEVERRRAVRRADEDKLAAEIRVRIAAAQAAVVSAPTYPTVPRRLEVVTAPPRSDCVDGPRPCGIACRYACPDGSCALDHASKDGMTLEEVGAVFGLTRERVRQIEKDGLEKLKRRLRKLGLDLSGLTPFESRD